MAEIKADLVEQTTTSTGTGAIMPSGSIQNRRAFSAVLTEGDTTRVLMQHATANEWEIFDTAFEGGALARGALKASSTGARVDFSAGTKIVGIVASAATWEEYRQELIDSAPEAIAAAAAAGLSETNAAASAIAAAAAVDPGYLAATRTYYNRLGWPIEPALGAVAFPDLPLPTFAALTRAGSAHCIGPTGLIRSTAANTARDAYDPITGEYLGKRIEGRGAKNIWLQSRSLGTTPNGNNRLTVLNNQTTGPDGTNSAMFLKEDTNSTTHAVTQSIAFVSGRSYTMRAIVKASSRKCKLLLPANAFDTVTNNPKSAYFNLEAGSVVNDSGNPTRDIVPLRDGWWIIYITATAQASVTGTATIRLSTNTTANSDFYVGNGSSGIYIYDLAIYENAWAGEFLPTTTTAVTQPAETLEFTGVSAALAATSGAMVFRGRFPRLSGVVETLMSLDNDTDDETVKLIKNADDELVFTVKDGGTEQASINLGAVVANVDFCVAAAWAANDFAACRDGGPPEIDASGTLPTVTELRCFQNGAAGEGFDGYFKLAGLFSVRVDNSHLRMISRLEPVGPTLHEAGVLQQLVAPMLLGRGGSNPVASRPEYGLSGLTDGAKWGGSVAIQNGSGDWHVIGVPIASATVGDLDVAAQTATRTNYGTTINSTNTGASGSRWRGGCRLTSTSAIFSPRAATRPGIVDLSGAGTLTFPDWATTYSLDLSGTDKFNGVVQGLDGKFYFGCYGIGKVMVYDPAVPSVTLEDFGLGSLLSGSQMFGVPILHPSGLIVQPPFTADKWLVIDTNYSPAKAWLTDWGVPVPKLTGTGGLGKFNDGFLNYKGELVFVPFDAATVAWLDLRRGKVTYEGMGLDLPGGKGMWNGAFQSPAGEGWGIPLDARGPSESYVDGAFLRLGIEPRAASTDWQGVTPWARGHQFIGSAWGGDGYRYSWPYGDSEPDPIANPTGLLKFGPFPVQSEDVLRSPYV